MSLRAGLRARGLLRAGRRGYMYGEQHPYNKRWQYVFRYPYITEPVDDEPTRVQRPEESKTDGVLGNLRRDFRRRIQPGLRLFNNRLHRLNTPFEKYFLPLWAATAFVFWPLDLSFKLMTIIPLAGLWMRVKNKVVDPEIEETYLRELLRQNPVVSKYFAEETTHLLDFDCEYIPGFPDAKEMPEFNNEIYRFFNSDANMTQGRLVMGDLESGAVMKVSFQTIPVRGTSRFQVGEPFFFFDVTAEINVNGLYEKVIIVDRQKSLEKYRPFLLNL